jgi:hypothetical protein
MGNEDKMDCGLPREECSDPKLHAPAQEKSALDNLRDWCNSLDDGDIEAPVDFVVAQAISRVGEAVVEQLAHVVGYLRGTEESVRMLTVAVHQEMALHNIGGKLAGALDEIKAAAEAHRHASTSVDIAAQRGTR